MRGWIIGAALLALVAGGAGALILSGGDGEPEGTPGPTPEPTRHFLIHLDQAVGTFGTATSEVAGVLRIATGGQGEVEAVSLAIGALETSKGSSGPISVALGSGESQVQSTGSTVSATFPVEFSYPLQYTVSGEEVVGDVVRPQKAHTGTAKFDGQIAERQWQAKLTLTPAQVEGTDFNLPEGSVDVQAAAVFETEDQFLRNAGGGVRVHCIELLPPKGAFTDNEVTTALRELNDIWRPHSKVFLTRDQITALNAGVAAVQPGENEARDPAKVSQAKCYSIVLLIKHDKGGGATADAARRAITIGKPALTRCKGATLGRLLAHGLGHITLRLGSDETGGAEDNLMRDCAPGTAVDPEVLKNPWSFVAEVAREVSIPGLDALTNATFTELEKLAGALPTAAPTVTPGPTRTPARRTPTPTPRSPAPTATPTPAATTTPSPTTTPTSTATPTPTATATPTPTATTTPTPAPTSSP